MMFRGVKRMHSGKVHVTRISDRVKEDLDGADVGKTISGKSCKCESGGC